MKAMGFAEFGGPEVLVEMDVPLPVPAPGQITIDVAWAGVNFVEILLRQGKVPGMSAPFVPGLEVSGRVAALGEGVTEFAIGQPVMAFTHSGYAARIAVDGRLAAPLDRPGKAVGLRDAAGLPCAAVTAHLMLDRVARMRAGDDVLIHGATGGVGTMAAQIARALGARRIMGTVGSSGKTDYATSIGYDHVLGREDFAASVRNVTSGRGVDVVLEGVSGARVAECLGIMAPVGRIVYFGDSNFVTPLQIALQDLRSVNAGVLGFSLGNLCFREPEIWRASAEAVLALTAEGRLKQMIAATLPLAEASHAHRLLEGGGTTGKFLLEVNAALE